MYIGPCIAITMIENLKKTTVKVDDTDAAKKEAAPIFFTSYRRLKECGERLGRIKKSKTC